MNLRKPPETYSVISKMQIAWKKLFIAGVAGFACGNAYSQLKKNPGAAWPILQCSAAAGVAGGVVGWGIAAYRRLPSHVYALSLGANLAIASGTFLALRRVVQQSLAPREEDVSPSVVRQLQLVLSGSRVDYFSSAASGGVTGALASLLSRHGMKSILLTSSSGVAFGIFAQFLYDRFELWRKRKAIELHYPELVRNEDRTEWNLQTFQSWFLGFWHKHSKSSQLDGDIALLKGAIEDERAKIEELDRLLQANEEDRTGSRLQSIQNSAKTDDSIMLRSIDYHSSTVAHR